MIAEIIVAVLLVNWFTRRESSALEQEAALRLAKSAEKLDSAKRVALEAEIHERNLKTLGWMRQHAEQYERHGQAASEKQFARNLAAAQRRARAEKWAAQGFVFQP